MLNQFASALTPRSIFGFTPNNLYNSYMPFALNILTISSAIMFAKPLYAIENPSYEVIPVTTNKIQPQSVRIEKPDFEIRHYQPMLVARVTHEQAYIKKALNLGFKDLANYIFGNNQQNIKIAMTAPVLENISEENNSNINFLNKSENFKQLGKPDDLVKNGYILKRNIYFVMPKNYDMAGISKPNNPKVELINLPERVFAVQKHGYIWRTENIDLLKFKFLEQLKEQNLIEDISKSLPNTYIAIYNPPITPPPFAKNEIWVELKNFSK